MKIICYGDSNTWGYDPRGYIGGRYETCWPALLAEKTGWLVLNQGENGREIPRSPVNFPENTDLLIIMLGTNDLLQRESPEAVCEKMNRFLGSLVLHKEKILLIAPPPMQWGEWVPVRNLIDDSVSLAKHYCTLAESLQVRFADAGKWNVPLAFDGVHFTQDGHRAFAAGLIDYLNKGE